MRRRRNNPADQARDRQAPAAYAEYEIYEEFEGLPADPRATVVPPAVSLPSIPAMRAAKPNASRSSPAAPGGSRVAPRPTNDSSWLNGPPVAPPRQTGIGQRVRPTDQHPGVPAAPDARGARWHDAPTGQSSAVRAQPANPKRTRTAMVERPVDPHIGPVDGNASFDASPVPRTTLAPRAANHHRRLTQQDRLAPSALSSGSHPGQHPGRVRRMTQRVADVVVIPVARHALPRPVRTGLGRLLGLIAEIARRPMLASALVLVVVLLGVLANATGAAQQAGMFSASAWHALAGLGPSSNAVASGPVVAPPNYDAKHYMDKYGFFQPGPATAIPGDEVGRLAQMMPAAIRAAAAYDKRYNKTIEPQMLLYWTHAEGIRARINYSNCANENTRPGTSYYTDIENCDHASFWQLGYGNQFSVIYVLRNAFTDLYGDPNDTQLVAKVGQGVLDFDKQIGTVPACGGYSCTFPAKSIDNILAGINLKTGVVAEGNWWAAVLSRDPAINCYMIAHALTFFSHAATRNWVGCYYASPCWQRNSDRLGDILTAWPDLLKAASIQG